MRIMLIILSSPDKGSFYLCEAITKQHFKRNVMKLKKKINLSPYCGDAHKALLEWRQKSELLPLN